MRLILIGAVVAAAVSLAGLLAMSGVLRSLLSPALTAEVSLSEFPLPRDFGLEPQSVSEYLVAELTRKGENDIALRMALGEEGRDKMVEIAIPRLVNPSVVRGMITKIKPLANVLSVGSFRFAARVELRNTGAARPDVALTLPGVVLVEAETGAAEIVQTSSGLTAIELGEMAADELRVLHVWLDEAAGTAGPEIGAQIRLGDGAGARGRVWVYGHGAKWQGADLQAMPLARWVISGSLALVFLGALLTLVIALLSRFRGQRRRRGVSPA